MKIKVGLCCWVLAVLVAICLVTYVVQFIKFDAKIKRFDKLRLGIKEIEVYLSLGKPSRTACAISGKTLRAFWGVELQEQDFEKKRYMVLIYDGTIYLRKDLFLFIDIDNEELVYKMKKIEYAIGDVIYNNFFGFK